MLSRLKSTVKGALGLVRGRAPAPPAPPPAARTEAPKPASAARVEPPKPAPRVEPPKPVEAAKPAPAPKVEAKPEPKVEPKVEAKPEPAPKAEAKPEPKVGPKVEAKPESKVEARPTKKESVAAKAAAAAKAPPPPAPAAKADEEESEDAAAKAKNLAAAAAAAAAGKVKGRMVIADMHSTDVESYIARAKANGRDPATYVVGHEGLNVLDDGTKFWGPVNNSSSRAKAQGQVLTIDQEECISCGTCVEQTNRVFYLPADGKATPIAQDGPMDLIEDAIEACPVTCIAWMDGEEAVEKGLATGIGEDWSHVVPEH